MLPQHSSEADDWMTPPDIIERVRATLGAIHLDPASSTQADLVVKADAFYSQTEDGLAQPWGLPVFPKNIFVNPPGGKRGNKSVAALFWRKLMQERQAGHINHAIFLAFSLEILRTTQAQPEHSVNNFTFCVPKKRIRFCSADGSLKKHPTHSNLIVYVPGKTNKHKDFVKNFKDLGEIK